MQLFYLLQDALQLHDHVKDEFSCVSSPSSLFFKKLKLILSLSKFSTQ
jgi:hypothetical protein